MGTTAKKNLDREILDALRPAALALPLGTKLRTRYRDYRRYLANVTADVAISTNTAYDMSTTSQGIRRLAEEFVAAGLINLCVYCYQVYTHDPELLPSVDDDENWVKIGRSHTADCEWVNTRAHRL